MSTGIRFIYSFLNIFAVFLCIAFYVMAIMEVGSKPTVEIDQPSNYEPQSSMAQSLPPEETVIENPFGDIVSPNLDIVKKLEKAKEVNEDTQGWLYVPNTGIDYPVVQYTDNDYYLRLDYDKRWKFAGCIFADFRDIGTNRDSLSRNYVIYGHNINTNHNKIRSTDEMFALLMNFKELEFAQQNQHIYYSTPEDEMVWEIFAAFYTDIEFDYINVEPHDEPTYQNLLDEARLRSEYIYDVDVTTSDKVITLSTCTYKFDTKEEQRFVVMARLVPDNSVVLREVVQNPSPKLPSFVEE